MDLFAAILVTITAITICGICIFILVCAVQPQFLRKLHGKANRLYQETESNHSSNENQDYGSRKSIDESINENSTITTQSTGRDKRAYLKSLERSLRTGRRIQDEEDNESNNETKLSSKPFNFISNFINKYIRRNTDG